MNSLALVGLCKMELPSYTIRWSEGGRIAWGAEVFCARDSNFGVIGSVESLTDGSGDELPPRSMTVLAPNSGAAADLVQPINQDSRVRYWLAEYSVATGAVVGTPELRFDGRLDQATLDLSLTVELTIIGELARLMELNIGNSLNPSWHKSIWPGETGHDNATGLGRPVAWGVESPTSPYQTTIQTNWLGRPA